MVKESEKFTDGLIFEGMTSISAVINSPESNDRKISKIIYDKSKEKSKYKELAYLRHQAERLNFSMEAVSSEEIDNLTIGSSHGGIIAVAVLSAGAGTAKNIHTADICQFCIVPEQKFVTFRQKRCFRFNS